MPPDPLLAAVTHALWPLVMVSVTAPIIISVANAHAAMSGRIRELAAERRDPATSPGRDESLRAQLALFRVRIRLSHAAHVLLHLSVLCRWPTARSTATYGDTSSSMMTR